MVREVNREMSDRLLDALLSGGDPGWLEELVRGCDPSRLGSRGVSPLHGAATLSDVKALHLCLGTASDVDPRSTPDLLTPLMLSVAWDRPHATALLLRAGADPYLADIEALSVWDYAASSPRCLRLLERVDDDNYESSLYETASSDSSTSADYRSLDRAFVLTSLFTEDESETASVSTVEGVLRRQSRLETEHSDSRISDDIGDEFETGMIAQETEDIGDLKPDSAVDWLERRMRMALKTDKRITEDVFVNPPKMNEPRKDIEDLKLDSAMDWFERRKRMVLKTDERISEDVFGNPLKMNEPQKYIEDSKPGSAVEWLERRKRMALKSDERISEDFFENPLKMNDPWKDIGASKPNFAVDRFETGIAPESDKQISLKTKDPRKYTYDSKPKISSKVKKQILREDDVFDSPRSVAKHDCWKGIGEWKPDSRRRRMIALKTDKRIPEDDIAKMNDIVVDDLLNDVKEASWDSDSSISLCLPSTATRCCGSSRSSVCSIAPTTRADSSCDTEELRDGVLQLMGECGPLTKTTKQVYHRYVKRHSRSPEKSPMGRTKLLGVSAELEALCGQDGKRLLEKWAPLETAMVLSLRTLVPPEPKVARTTRPPNLFFNYLLLEPADPKSLAEFVDTLFYVGKGKAERPYAHLHEALKQDARGVKVDRIRRIWAGGGRVICLRPFCNIGSDEALTREAAMIDAATLPRLTNTKRGEYHGLVSTWCPRDKCRLGAVLLAASWQSYQHQASQLDQHASPRHPESKFAFYT